MRTYFSRLLTVPAMSACWLNALAIEVSEIGEMLSPKVAPPMIAPASTLGGALPITPFVQAGVGAIRYNIDESIVQTNATSLTGNVGVGADFCAGQCSTS